MQHNMKNSRIYNIIGTLILGWSVLCGASAQEKPTFSVMSLNVDGLPGKIFVFNVNSDGPISAGSERISEYLASKNCDILCLQEDFNYRWEIWSRLFASYEHDEWTGGIIIEEKDIDFAHLQNLKFECDGLNMLWKKDIQTTNYERVPWTKCFGKFSHDFDDMITKGFRRHDLTLANGLKVVVYNMHMDASSDRDIQKKNDTKDKEARLSQWQQLRDYILDHLDNRPVIVTGDMNSYYRSDPVKTQFIDIINASGKATCGDVWIEKCNNGTYPLMDSEKLADETLDKILYINPVGGDQIAPVSFTLDRTGYLYEGKPMGDHYPIIATFEFTNQTKQSTGIQTPHVQGSESVAYDLRGHRLQEQPTQKGIYIYKGKKITK